MADKKKKTTKTKKVVKKEKLTKRIKNIKVFKKIWEFIKKNKTILIIVLVATIINVLVVYAGVKDSNTKSDEKITAGYVHYWVEESKADSALITIFCQDGMKYCTEYEPVVRQVASEYQLPVYWVDLSSITDVEYQELLSTYKDLQSIKIPYTMITQKGEKITGIEGSLDSDSLVKTLTEVGLIQSK